MFDEQQKKKLLRRMPHGIYVCGCVNGAGDDLNAFTLTWATQTSFKPPILTMGVKRDTISNQFIRESRVLTVNFLGKSQKELAEFFFKPRRRIGNKFENIDFHTGETGAPILDDAQGAAECRVLEIVEQGDHDVIIAEVVATEMKEGAEAQLVLSDTAWQYGG